MTAAAPRAVSADAARAELCRRSFADFVRIFWKCVPGAGTLIWNWHLDVLCEEMQAVAERVFAGLPAEQDTVFNVPPGTSKSTIISILFPAWVWGRMPTARILSASHTGDLVLDLATKSRSVITHELYQRTFPEVQLAADQDTKSYYRNTHGGDRYTCTVAGKSPMGFHAHFQLVDDPIDPKKARSEAEKITAKEFMTEVLPGRKVDKEVTATVLIMQRLGVGDPTDVLLQNARKDGGRPVRRICLPAELTDDVSPPELRRHYEANGGLLDPRRLPASVLKNQRAVMGEYAYSGQFLQRPRPAGGGLFKDVFFKHFARAAPYECKRVRFWDRACLVAGTLVETARGTVPIEGVRAGDRVLTRRGYRRVTWSGPTKAVTELVRVEFTDGRSVTGTADHPLWVQGEGWVELADVRCGSYCVSVQEVQGDTWLRKSAGHAARPTRGLSSTASTIHGAPGSVTSPRGDGTPFVRRGGRIRCTAPSGGTTTAPSPRGTTSTTSAATTVTTAWATLSACPARSTTAATTPSLSSTRRSGPPSCAAPTCGRRGRTCPTVTGCAATVVPRSAPGTPTPPAPGSAPRSAGSGAPTDPWSGSVAAVSSPSAGAPRPAIVAAVIRLRAAAPATVYDLTVEGEHEFFAGGVLVHNSTHDGGCYTAGVLMALAPDGRVYIEDVVHGQWAPDERNAKMLATAQRDRRRYGRHAPKIYVEMEGGSSGRDAWLGVVRALAGFTVKEAKVTGSKDVRAEPWATCLAAGNATIVDGGASETGAPAPWDVEAFIEEHLNFKPDPTSKRLGGFKDQVDACSGAYNILVGARARADVPLRKFELGRRRPGGPPVRFLCLSLEELQATAIEEPALLVVLDDALPAGQQEPGPLPAHALHRPAGVLRLQFADLERGDPAVQESWGAPLEPYGRPAEQLVMDKGHARKLWGFLTRAHDPAPHVVVIAGGDAEDRRPLSLAMACSDALHYKREESFLTLEESDSRYRGDPPCRHVYEVTRAGRGLVAA